MGRWVWSMTTTIIPTQQKYNKDEDEFVATKAATNVANDDCNSNNDQHKGTRRIATPCLIFVCV
jgi:hypothetical protein